MAQPLFASALSTSPSMEAATAEAAADLVAGLGGAPELVLGFASAHHAPSLDDLPSRLLGETGAGRLVGCSAGAVVSGSEEIEAGPALALLGIRSSGLHVRITPLKALRDDSPEGFRVEPQLELPEDEDLILLTDPFSFPTEPWLKAQDPILSDRQVVGGLASGGGGPHEHALWVDDQRLSGGGIALGLGGDVQVLSAVSQGCRPVGEPLVVTDCRGNAILGLRGKPAIPTLLELLGSLPERDRDLFRRGPHVGLAVDPTRSQFAASDLLVRNVLGLLPGEDGIGIGDHGIRRGMTIQFMLRDAASASDELNGILAERRTLWGAEGGAGAAALLFTCGGRGSHLFRAPSHDARALQEHLGPDLPVAGFFANGEIGPVSGRPHLHGFTASIGYLAARGTMQP